MSKTSRTFSIELMVTEKCNLGCTYCYVSNRNKNMTKESFHKAWDELPKWMEKQICDEYSISYFGGEPLENFEMIKYIHEYVKNDPLCKHESIVSNLTLITPEIADYIVKENMNVSFSFDGLSSNESRPLLPVKENNGYTNILDLYNDKWDLILKVCNNACHIVISPDNIHLLSKNVDYLLKKGISNIDYSLAKDDIWTAEDVEKFKFYYNEYINNIITKIKNNTWIQGGINFIALADGFAGFLGMKRHHSCFVGTSGCAITPDGEYYACARFASKNIFKYTDDLNFDEIAEDLDIYNYNKCKACEIYYYCNQGCVYSQLRNDNEPLDSFCEIYKFIVKEMIRANHILKKSKFYMDILRGELDELRKIGKRYYAQRYFKNNE